MGAPSHRSGLTNSPTTSLTASFPTAAGGTILFLALLSPAGQAQDGPIFLEAGPQTGLDFVQFNGMTGELFMAEITGSGGAFFDFDNDGDLDVYLVQGQLLGVGKTPDDAIFPPRYPVPLSDRLYRNDLDRRSGRLRFTDVTEKSGLAAFGYGMGIATGDYDNDGWVDFYLTNDGPNELWHNEGDGTFSEITAASGTGDERWSVAATFLDYDRDGWLDLFVGNYIAVDPQHRRICRDTSGAVDYCGPGTYPPLPDRLFRNRGDGTFEDATHAAGLREGFGSALGAVAADFDGNGWLDLYVTNDGLPNNLWMNRGQGADGRVTFTDEALLAGCSVNAAGEAEASMGVTVGDFDRDGDFDLFMTHLTGETNTLFRNDGSGLFDDHTRVTGLSQPSSGFTSFGVGWIDYDNDGWLDVLAVSGAVRKIEALARRGDPFPLHQPNQLFRNLGDGRFVEVTDRAGPVFRHSEVSRGLIFGDIDEDGDRDALIVNNAGPARLLINQVGQRRHWLGLRLVGAPSGAGSPDRPVRDLPVRDLLGARVAVDRPGRPTLWSQVRTDGSFCSANDPRILLGLGDDPAIGRVLVLWPDGSREAFAGIAADAYTTLRPGTGARPDAAPPERP